MNKISLNDLNVDNNKFFFNINDTFIEFRITAIENDLCITLRIDSSDEELTFYSMEDVLMFVQKIIKEKKESKGSIISYYNELNNQGELKQKVTVTKTNGAFLTKDNIYSAISGYFGQGKNYKVSATSEVYDGTEGKEIFFYLVEHLDYDGIKKDVKTGLTNQDLKNAFNQAIRGNQEIHEGDFNDFMAFLYASNINPETLIGEGKDAVATIKAAMKGFKDNVLYWRKSKDNVNAAQLMFNNANHYGSLLSR